MEAFRKGARALVGILALAACVWAGQLQANGHRHYWLLKEFLAAFPHEAPLMAEFAAQVAGDPTPLGVALPQPVRVAVIYPGNQISDYWRRNVTAFEGRLRDLEVPYRLSTFFTRPGTELRRQEEQIAEALAADPDYLVFTLDVSRHRRIIERIIARGHPKLILQNITTPVRAWGERQPFLYVGFDHVQGTGMLVEAMLADAPRPRRAAILYWKPGYVSQMRGDTFVQAMEQAGVSVEARFYTDADRDSARKATLVALAQNPELDLIYASATDLAFGALDALKQTGRLGQVKVNGWGGGSEELRAIRDRELDWTVMRVNDDAGVAMAEAIKRDLQERAVPQVYSGRLKLIDQQVDWQKLETCKRKAFRYSGGAAP